MTENSVYEKMAEQALERNDFVGCAAVIERLRTGNDGTGADLLTGRMGSLVEHRLLKLTEALRREARNPEPRWVRVACRQSTEFYETSIRPALEPYAKLTDAERAERMRAKAIKALAALAKTWKKVGDYTSAEQIYQWALEAAAGGKMELAVQKKLQRNAPAAQRQAAKGFFRPRA